MIGAGHVPHHVVVSGSRFRVDDLWVVLEVEGLRGAKPRLFPKLPNPFEQQRVVVLSEFVARVKRMDRPVLSLGEDLETSGIGRCMPGTKIENRFGRKCHAHEWTAQVGSACA